MLGRQTGERRPDALVVVLDAGNLPNHLRFAMQLVALGLPTVIALNMVDLAERDGLLLDPERLAAELGVPVVIAVRAEPGLTGRARGVLEALAQSGRADRRAFLLLSELEEAEKGDTPDARSARAQWLRDAANAAPEPRWRCANCGTEHAAWGPVCSACGTVGQIAWTATPRAAMPVAGTATPAAPAAAGVA